MREIRRNNLEMIKDFTEREEKIKLDSGEYHNSNSFVDINTFVKQEVLDARK